MSGTPVLMTSQPFAFHEQNYQRVIGFLGLENASTEERIKVLLKTPAQEIITKLGPSVLSVSAIDGNLILGETTFQKILNTATIHPRGKAWCRDILIGDAQHDVSGTH
jgi:hypothetical protein